MNPPTVFGFRAEALELDLEPSWPAKAIAGTEATEDGSYSPPSETAPVAEGDKARRT